MKKEFPPVAVCTKCGTYSKNDLTINERCPQKHDGKRCQGVLRSAIAPGDWDTCPSCNGTGREENLKCLSCQGSGFIFVRKTP